MRLQLPTWLIKLSGDLYLHRHPFWIVYKPHHYSVTGPEIRAILDTARPGDILLRRYADYVNTLFTPGFWGHAALCVSSNEVVHAIGVGVVKEDVITFCRTDSVCLLRVNDATQEQINAALACADAHQLQRTAYDFRFRDRNRTVYCTELVNVCYGGIFNSDHEIIAGNCILSPDGIRRSSRVTMLREFTHASKRILARLSKKANPPCTGDPGTCEETLRRRAHELRRKRLPSAPPQERNMVTLHDNEGTKWDVSYCIDKTQRWGELREVVDQIH
jgi:hypothetical protein